MAEAADRAAWARTAGMITQLYNLGRGAKDRWRDPYRTCPWVDRRQSKPPPPSEEDKAWLRQTFPEHAPTGAEEKG